MKLLCFVFCTILGQRLVAALNFESSNGFSENGDTMIELAFAACLTSAPDVCADRSIWFIDVSQDQCHSQALGNLEKWNDVNPTWAISGWSCKSIDNRSASISN